MWSIRELRALQFFFQLQGFFRPTERQWLLRERLLHFLLEGREVLGGKKRSATEGPSSG